MFKIAVHVRSSSSLYRQLARYGLVGVFVYLADLGLFSLIISLNTLLYQEANIAGRLLGAFLGFILHKRYTFSDLKQSNGALKQFVAYVALFAFNTMLSGLLLWGAVKLLPLPLFFLRLLVDILVIAVAYVASRFFIFKGEIR